MFRHDYRVDAFLPRHLTIGAIGTDLKVVETFGAAIIKELHAHATFYRCRRQMMPAAYHLSAAQSWTFQYSFAKWQYI